MAKEFDSGKLIEKYPIMVKHSKVKTIEDKARFMGAAIIKDFKPPKKKKNEFND